MSPPALEIHGLTKRYGKFTALQDLSLTIPTGEIFALLGPNGAGKTTMIGSVCGLVKATTWTRTRCAPATKWGWCRRRSTSTPSSP